MSKHEWRKKEKHFYVPKNKPEVIDIPEFRFLTLEGEGNPNSEPFSECITMLYGLSYPIKMTLKKSEIKPKGYSDYTVYPLEGIWDVNEEAKKNPDKPFDKDDLVYKIMIRQPDFVTDEFFREVLSLVKKKKPYPLLDKVQYEKIKDGKCIQMLHKGSYDDEPASFQSMEEFAAQNNLKRTSKKHREIYLSDFRKVPVEKLKTVLRFKVE